MQRSKVRNLSTRRKVHHGSAQVHGFTLIELIVALGVVLIVSAMALPQVQSSMDKYRLNSSVATVTGIIQSTRYQAISQGYPFQIVFSKAAGTYQLTSDAVIPTDGIFTNLAAPFDHSIPIGSSLVNLGADTTLQFGGGGSVKATSGSTTIVLTGANNKTGTITVTSYGNVKVVYAP